MTIVDAVKAVMLANSTPMTAEEIYRAIRDQALYELDSRDPLGIVKRQIRRHCEGLDLTTAAPAKHISYGGQWQIRTAAVMRQRSGS